MPKPNKRNTTGIRLTTEEHARVTRVLHAMQDDEPRAGHTFSSVYRMCADVGVDHYEAHYRIGRGEQ